MSRTIRGEKSGGYDFWSRRPHSGGGYGPGVKSLCHRVERQQGRDAVRQGLREAGYEQSSN